jgi:hypothetical protein
MAQSTHVQKPTAEIMGVFDVWQDTATLQYAIREGQCSSCMFAYLSLAYFVTVSMDSILIYC